MADVVEQQGEQGTSQQPAGAAAGGGSPPARPEWAPEKFWDPEKGLRSEDLAKSYVELEKQRGQVTSGMKDRARKEVEGEIWKDRPESADAYVLGAPEDAVDVVVLTEAPAAGFEPEPGKTYLQLNPKSEAMTTLRAMAHKAGVSAADFQAFMAQVARENGQRVPTEADIQAERERVWGELGEHGQRRAQYLAGSLRTILGDRVAHIEDMLKDAKSIAALEELTARATGSRFAPPSNGTRAGGPLTEAEIRAKMARPEYPRDAALVAEVQRDWETLYPPSRRA